VGTPRSVNAGGIIIVTGRQAGNSSNSNQRDVCGSQGSEWVPDGNWSEACSRHDSCYSTTGANKEVCDITLIWGITAICSAKIFIHAACVVPGVLYGGSLIILGWTPAWNPALDAYDAAHGH
jgi:hypothetical protein